jgi:hypothetical protein
MSKGELMSVHSDNKPAAGPTKPAPRKSLNQLRFDWLKAPSLLLIVIGLTGILSAKVKYFTSAFSFLNLPSFVSSLIITALSCVLLAVALCSQPSRDSRDSELEQDNWRSI